MHAILCLYRCWFTRADVLLVQVLSYLCRCSSTCKGVFYLIRCSRVRRTDCRVARHRRNALLQQVLASCGRSRDESTASWRPDYWRLPHGPPCSVRRPHIGWNTNITHSRGFLDKFSFLFFRNASLISINNRYTPTYIYIYVMPFFHIFHFIFR